MFRSVDLHQLNENSALIQLDLDRQCLDRQYLPGVAEGRAVWGAVKYPQVLQQCHSTVQYQ